MIAEKSHQVNKIDRTSVHELCRYQAKLLGRDESALVDMMRDVILGGHMRIERMTWLLQLHIHKAQKR